MNPDDTDSAAADSDAARAELAALRQRCEELERVLRLILPHIGHQPYASTTRMLQDEARKALRGGA